LDQEDKIDLGIKSSRREKIFREAVQFINLAEVLILNKSQVDANMRY
jgi:hypothetical protein